MTEIITAAQLDTIANGALASAKEFVIDTPEMFQLAGEELREIMANKKTVEAERLRITSPLHQSLRAANALFATPAAKWDEAERVIKGAMLRYTTAQEAKAQESRKIAEKAALAERMQLMAQAAAATKDAEEAEARGDVDAKHAALEEVATATLLSEVMTHSPAETAAEAVSGISHRTTYGVNDVDLLKLVKAVATGMAPMQCLEPNMKFLGAQARAFKMVGVIYPGVTVTAERSIAARAAPL